MTDMRIVAGVLLAIPVLLLSACEAEPTIRQPVALSRQAIGHYCKMIIVDHPGPKAQVHEKNRAEPLWFSSVRDALVYMRLPGEAQAISAVYVHDMAKAKSWDKPQNSGIWMNASQAHYVIGSKRRGGMGANETVPFSDQAAANAFVKEYGGKVVTYSQIPNDYILGDKGEHSNAMPRGSHGASDTMAKNKTKGL